MSEQKYYITPTGNEITIPEGKAAEPLPLKDGDGEEYIREEIINFPNGKLAKAYVSDFSEKTATQFIKEHFQYQGVD